ncbi:lytic transglycosylase domain-containing protein [Microbacterium sp. NEAU-LLC]|uniref:Lytic transglycosylase domain-containing protein n=1 Tax=Microbacterium helvum TaxID=2773713 RepID=A0ABR8NK01_9MICO|nr:lytic transglycosylase domain-containing protein [Microbacterium helvum]MBD3940117.1 lytic transglycosylase domain-containing protein [Microbacterium helvum]
MRSHTTFLPARRTLRRAERRLRRRPVLVVATLALGLVATAGFTTAAPASLAEASGQTPDFALASYSTPLVAQISGTDAQNDADSAVTAAAAAMTAASTVTSDITASGLDVGTPDTTVDTTQLSTAVEQLERAQALPQMYSADFEETVTSLTASVSEQTAGLRGKLDAAIALKAQQEAEEKARQEAEAAAAAQAAADAAAKQKKKSSGSSKSSSAAPAPSYAASGTSAGEAQATARSMIAGYGWGDDQFACLVSLWNKESGWRYNAANPSGAYGIPQALPGSKMGAYGSDWRTNPATQIAWGLGYISGRYGTPCGAWGHSQSVGWY